MKTIRNVFLFGLLILLASCLSRLDNKSKIFDQDPMGLSIKNTESDTGIFNDYVSPIKLETTDHIESNLKTLFPEDKKTGKSFEEKPFYDSFLEKEKDRDKTEHVKIVLNAVPIQEVVPAFARLLGFNYYIDSGITGVATMAIDSDLKKEELWKVFEQILWLSGSYCSLEDGIVRILPFSAMPKEKQLMTSHNPQANVSVIMFRLKNIKSSNIVNALKPFLNDGAVIVDVPEQNAILVVEIPSNMLKIASLIKLLDSNSKIDIPRAAIKCSNIPPSQIVKELSVVLPVLGFPVKEVVKDSKKEEVINAINIQAVDRMQFLVVAAVNDEAIEEVKKWVALLDNNDIGEQEKVFIYEIKNNRAEVLVKVLSAIFNIHGSAIKANIKTASTLGVNSGVSTSSGGSSSNSSSSISSSSNANSTVSGGKSTESSTGFKDTGKSSLLETRQVSIFDVPVKVFADEIDERLIIRTTDRVYASMKAVLERIDTVPSQVLLHITIATVDLASSTTLQEQIMYKFEEAGMDVGTDYNIVKTDDKGHTTYPQGFNYIVNVAGFKAIFNALATEAEVKVLATPQVLVKSNTQARVQVGEDVPVIKQNVVNTSSSGPGKEPNPNITQNIEYKKVGIILEVTPHITKGGLISVDVGQTISNVKQGTTDCLGGLAPSITTKSISTSLAIPNGATIIIGGIIQDKKDSQIQTVPFFDNVPILNRLLGRNTSSSDRTELLLMITANIVNKTTPLQDMISRFTNAADLVQDGIDNTNKNNNATFNIVPEKNTSKLTVD